MEGPNGLQDALRELRAEHRAAQEELEEASQLVERAGRSLDEVALDFLYRGDTIRVTVADRSWTGTVVHVGVGVMTLRTPTKVEVDIAYPGVTSMRVVERARVGGRSRTSKHPGEIVARLRELQNSGEEVQVGGRHLLSIEGTVQVVARSHVELRGRDGSEWVVPLSELDYLSRAGESSR